MPHTSVTIPARLLDALVTRWEPSDPYMWGRVLITRSGTRATLTGPRDDLREIGEGIRVLGVGSRGLPQGSRLGGYTPRQVATYARRFPHHFRNPRPTVAVGDRVDIKVGDETGSWGIVRKVDGPYFHVGIAGAATADRIYERHEINKPRG